MVNGKKLEQVDSFTYLGSNVRKDAECTGEVKVGYGHDGNEQVNKDMAK